MNPTAVGTVISDGEAFRQIESRFAQEFEELTKGIEFDAGPVPFWSLIRITFPVAESLGNLVYGRSMRTAAALRTVLSTDFEAVRPGYRGKAAVLTLLLRHSLTHQDMPRRVANGPKNVGWFLDSGCDDTHLELSRSASRAGVLIRFQPRAFHRDILAVCRALERRQYNGEIMSRYNDGLRLELAGRQLNENERAAADELDLLWSSA